MNLHALGIQILWVVAQVTLFFSVGCIAYLLSARRSPAYRSLLVAGTLLVALTMTALAVSPWPRWYDVSLRGDAQTERVSSEASRDTAHSTGTTAAPSSNNSQQNERRADTAGPATNPADSRTAVITFFQAFRDSLLLPRQIEGEANAWRWPAVMAALVLVGITVGLLRIIIGLWAISRYRRCALPIMEENVLAELGALRASIGCRQSVTLCESASVGTPATIGWRRPLILLPSEWHSWDASDRRAVLAHELGHIARGDYVAGIVARLTTALHFYHPLAHWLARRMRFEQELAADACGVALSGGKESYVIAIARMALQHDTRQLAWAARPFFPTQSTFLRRIEMLRSTSGDRISSQRPGKRGLTLAVLTALALVIIGFRAPLDAPRSVALGADPVKPSADAGKLELKQVPESAVLWAAGRPAAILSRDQKLRESAAVVERETGLSKNLGIAIDELEEFRAMLLKSTTPGGAPFNPVVLMRSTKPYAWKSIVEMIDKPEERERAGQKYFRQAETDKPRNTLTMSYFRPDDRTVVFSPAEEALQAYIDAQRGGAAPRFTNEFKRVANDDAALLADMTFFSDLIEEGVRKANEPTMQSFGPLWRNVETIVVGAGLNGKLTAEAYAICKSPDAAKSTAETVTAAKVLGQNLLPALKQEASRAQLPQELVKLQAAMIKEVEGFLAQVKPGVDGKVVAVKVEGSDAFGPLLAGVVMPAAAAAREAARRTQSMNNLKQIGLAMHNYAAEKGTFPPAVALGPDGKTPHSWRVTILPYLDQEQLYRQYNQNEPWDSETNRKVLAKMPAVYLYPGVSAPGGNSTSSCYYVLTGGGAPFSATAAEKGVKLQDITDGTSHTILAVEAKRDIPWTKPEDIPFDAGGDLAKFGGYQQGGFFNAAIADGSVRVIANEIDPKILKAFITMAGGEDVRFQ